MSHYDTIKLDMISKINDSTLLTEIESLIEATLNNHACTKLKEGIRTYYTGPRAISDDFDVVNVSTHFDESRFTHNMNMVISVNSDELVVDHSATPPTRRTRFRYGDYHRELIEEHCPQIFELCESMEIYFHASSFQLLSFQI